MFGSCFKEIQHSFISQFKQGWGISCWNGLGYRHT